MSNLVNPYRFGGGSLPDPEITELDNLRHYNSGSAFFNMCNPADDLIFMAHSGLATDGFARTLELDGSFNLINRDLIEHDTVLGSFNGCAQLDSTHIALAYNGDGNVLTLKVFSVDGSYNITEESSLVIGTASVQYSHILVLDSTHIVLVVGGIARTIEFDGSWNATVLDSITIDTTYNDEYDSAILLDSSHFAVAYPGVGTDGFIKTFNINGSYVISQLDSLEFELAFCNWTSLDLLTSGKIFLAWQGSVTQKPGAVRVISYDGGYNLSFGGAELEHDETISWMYNNSIVLNEEYVLVVANNGKLKLFQIDPTTNGITEILSMSYVSGSSVFVDAILLKSVGTSHYIAIAYRGVDSFGYIKTFSITNIPII